MLDGNYEGTTINDRGGGNQGRRATTLSYLSYFVLLFRKGFPGKRFISKIFPLPPPQIINCRPLRNFIIFPPTQQLKSWSCSCTITNLMTAFYYKYRHAHLGYMWAQIRLCHKMRQFLLKTVLGQIKNIMCYQICQIWIG